MKKLLLLVLLVLSACVKDNPEAVPQSVEVDSLFKEILVDLNVSEVGVTSKSATVDLNLLYFPESNIGWVWTNTTDSCGWGEAPESYAHGTYKTVKIPFSEERANINYEINYNTGDRITPKCAADFSTITEDSTPLDFVGFFLDDLYYETGQDYRYLFPSAEITGGERYRINSNTTYSGAGYAIGTCYNPTSIHLFISTPRWEQHNLTQKFWLMYHEMGHNVFKYFHTRRNDHIMVLNPLPRVANKTVEDFKRARTEMFNEMYVVYLTEAQLESICR